MATNIAFPYYPTSNRTPGVFADVDGSKANTALTQTRTLIVGQMLVGVGQPNVPVLVSTLPQVGQLFGFDSMIYAMVAQYLGTDSFGELWVIGIADPAGQAATGSIAFTAPGAIGTGIYALYVGGVSIPVPVLAGDTPTTIAARAVALVNVNPASPASATSAAGVLTFTANHVGLLGNDVGLTKGLLGSLGGEFPVSGLVDTIQPMTGGAGVPSLVSVLAGLGDVSYDFVCSPFNDTASLNALDAFFNFGTGRWSWQSMLYGGYFTAARGTPGELVTFGTSRNGPNGSAFGASAGFPQPLWIIAAEYTAACAVSLRADPNTPLQNIVLNLIAPAPGTVPLRSVRNTLLYDGVSTYTVNRARQVILERAITLYQLNPAGLPDNAYLDVETMYGTALLIRGWQQEMVRLFPRSKLFEDGNPIPAGSNATTAQQIRLATLAWYRAEVDAGNAQDPDKFAAAVLSQNAGNGLVKELLPFLLPQQLRQIAGLVQFTKP